MVSLNVITCPHKISSMIIDRRNSESEFYPSIDQIYSQSLALVNPNNLSNLIAILSQISISLDQNQNQNLENNKPKFTKGDIHPTSPLETPLFEFFDEIFGYQDDQSLNNKSDNFESNIDSNVSINNENKFGLDESEYRTSFCFNEEFNLSTRIKRFPKIIIDNDLLTKNDSFNHPHQSYQNFNSPPLSSNSSSLKPQEISPSSSHPLKNVLDLSPTSNVRFNLSHNNAFTSNRSHLSSPQFFSTQRSFNSPNLRTSQRNSPINPSASNTPKDVSPISHSLPLSSRYSLAKPHHSWIPNVKSLSSPPDSFSGWVKKLAGTGDLWNRRFLILSNCTLFFFMDDQPNSLFYDFLIFTRKTTVSVRSKNIISITGQIYVISGSNSERIKIPSTITLKFTDSTELLLWKDSMEIMAQQSKAGRAPLPFIHNYNHQPSPTTINSFFNQNPVPFHPNRKSNQKKSETTDIYGFLKNVHRIEKQIKSRNENIFLKLSNVESKLG